MFELLIFGRAFKLTEIFQQYNMFTTTDTYLKSIVVSFSPPGERIPSRSIPKAN